MNKEIKSVEEAANEYADKHGFRVPFDGTNNFYDDNDVQWSKEGFIADAKWQASQFQHEAYGLDIRKLEAKFEELFSNPDLEKDFNEWLAKRNKEPQFQHEAETVKGGELLKIRNRLYDKLPTGEVHAFDLITIIKEHLNDLDKLIL